MSDPANLKKREVTAREALAKIRDARKGHDETPEEFAHSLKRTAELALVAVRAQAKYKPPAHTSPPWRLGPDPDGLEDCQSIWAGRMGSVQSEIAGRICEPGNAQLLLRAPKLRAALLRIKREAEKANDTEDFGPQQYGELCDELAQIAYTATEGI